MKTFEMIHTACDFLELHKINNIEDWDIAFHVDTNIMYLNMFYNLDGGLYGNTWVDERAGDKFSCVEISARDSYSGNPILFEWEYWKDD